jgi:hypothetical protein
MVDGERHLTYLVIDFLNGIHRRPFRFSENRPEDFENNNSASVDIAVGYGQVGSKFSKNFYKIEAKRLTNLSANVKAREYLVATKDPDKKNGGVERFKIGKHGGDLPRCGMLGYVQSHTFVFWHSSINAWILEFSKQPAIKPNWKRSELLQVVDVQSSTCRFSSSHSRENATSSTIHLDHFWIDLT